MSGTLTLAIEQLKARRKTALILLAMVAMLAAAAVTSGVSVLGSAGDRVDRLYEQTGRPDVFLSAGSVDQFDAILSGREGVDDLGTPYPVTGATVSRPGGSGVGLRLAGVDDPAAIGVGAPILRSGRWAAAPGEFVMDAAWAADTGANIGETIEIEIDGVVTEMTSVGTAVDLGDCFYPNCDPVTGFVTTDGFDRVSTHSAFRGYASLAPGVGDEQFAGAILAERPGVWMGTWSDTRADLVVSAEISSYFVSGLGVFVMFASALVVASTAVAVVAARRREIALLKAMGSTPSQVAGSIVGEHLVVAAPAAVVGWILGSILAPGLEVGLVGALGRSAPQFRPILLVVSLVLVLGVLTAATAVPAIKAGRLSTVESLRNPPSLAGERLQRLADRLPGSANVSLGARLAVARPMRMMLAAVALALAATAIYTTWSLGRTVDQIFAEPEMAGDPWDITITPADAGDSAGLDAVLAAESDVAGWYRGDYLRVLVDDSQVTAFAVAPGATEPAHVVLEGRRATEAGEAMAAFGFMDEFGYSVGDTVDVTFAERTFEVELVGRHADAEDTGRIMIIPAATFSEAGIVWDLPMWRVSVVEGADSFAVGARLDAELAADTNIFVLEPDLEAADFVRVVLLILTAVIIVVALGNLAATMASTARERERRTGVLRSIGFSSRQLLGQAAIAGAVVGALAAIVGIPFGFLVSKVLLSVIMSAVGIGPGLATVPIIAPVLVLLPLCILAGALIGVVASAPTLRTSTSDLLRAE